MAVLSEQQVTDLLLGDTDPRELVLFMAQMAGTMDPQEVLQRETILRALEVHATKRMVTETHDLVVETARVVWWTRWAVLAAAAAAVASTVAAVRYR